MKAKMIISWLVAGALLGPAVALTADNTDADREHPKHFVKDSAITAKIKAKLAAEHLTSMALIHVDTDENGVVWLSGKARSQDAADKAGELARGTEGVKDVHNHIRVKKED